MAPLAIIPHHAERNRPKQHKHPNDTDIPKAKDSPLHRPITPPQRPRKPIDQEASRQDSEIERRIIMMHVRNARHGDERQIMEEPADDGIEAGIVDMVDVVRFEIVVAALPADEVPQREAGEEGEGGGRGPVDERVAEQEVFDDVVVPAAHAEADVEDGPLPEVRGQVVLFVRVRDQGVVGRHHGHVEVQEVADEGRFVGSGVAGRDWWFC